MIFCRTSLARQKLRTSSAATSVHPASSIRHRLSRCGYTLIEVLTAAVIVGVGVSAAVSMSTTMTLQQELSWRVSVALNYQENACRLWQLGLSPTDVTAALPGTAGNPFLSEVLDEIQVNKTTITSDFITANNSTLGTMENATNATQVANFSAGESGSTTTFNLFRNVTRSSTYEP